MISALSFIPIANINMKILQNFINTFSKNDMSKMFKDIYSKTELSPERTTEILSNIFEKTMENSKELNDERFSKSYFINKSKEILVSEYFGKIATKDFQIIK